MLRYTLSLVTKHSEHPLLASLFVLAALFVAGSVVLSQYPEHNVVSGFLGIYAIMMASMGALGYGALFLARTFSKVQRMRGLSQ